MKNTICNENVLKIRKGMLYLHHVNPLSIQYEQLIYGIVWLNVSIAKFNEPVTNQNNVSATGTAGGVIFMMYCKCL